MHWSFKLSFHCRLTPLNFRKKWVNKINVLCCGHNHKLTLYSNTCLWLYSQVMKQNVLIALNQLVQWRRDIIVHFHLQVLKLAYMSIKTYLINSGWVPSVKIPVGVLFIKAKMAAIRILFCNNSMCYCRRIVSIGLIYGKPIKYFFGIAAFRRL